MDLKPFEFEDITDSLNDRQKLFCMFYVGECKFNGKKAAEMAGYDANNSASYAVYLLNNPNISQFIESCKKDLGLRIGVTSEMIAKEYASIGFSKISDFIEEGNQVKDVTQIDKTEVVSSLKKTVFESESGTKTVTEIKLHDKISALEKLSRMIGVEGAKKLDVTSIQLGKDADKEQYE